MDHVSTSPPLIPDGRISRARLAAVAFPMGPSQTVRGSSACSRTPLGWLVIPTARRHPVSTVWSGSVSRHVLMTSPATYREPLRPHGCYPSRGGVVRLLGQRYPAFVARIGSCAPPNPSTRLCLSLLQMVFAGCSKPLLVVGGSRRYLHVLSVGAWTHTPPRSPGAVPVFSPEDIGLLPTRTGSARGKSHDVTSTWGTRFRGCSHSMIFRLQHLLGSRVTPTADAGQGS